MQEAGRGVRELGPGLGPSLPGLPFGRGEGQWGPTGGEAFIKHTPS